MRRLGSALVLLIVLGSILAPVPAAAQYFGRNKVQYETFDFKVLRTEHFDVYYYDQERPAAEIAGRMAERWYARLSRVLDHQLSRRQPLILYASHPDFEQTNAIPGEIGEGTGGVTEFLKRRIVLPMAGPLAETDHVIGHELVHAFQFDITGQRNAGSSFGGAPAVARLPLWFVEGMAEYLSLGPEDPHTAMWMRDAAHANKLPSIKKLYDPRYFPYRYGQALWAYVAGRWGDDAVGKILIQATRAPDAERAIAMVTGVGVDTLSREWQQSIRDWYEPLRGKTDDVAGAGRVVVAGHEGERLNLAPALSPDGKQVVFLSEKSRLSIEMYLADAATGRVIRSLTKSTVDPHLESLEFIYSTASFSPDGHRVAYATVERGKPVLSVFDLDRDRVVNRVVLGDLDEIFNPTWAPDGRRVAFAANQGGLTDLFVVDVQSRAVRRLTQDAYSALQPAWSPDGRRIAFVTDRFTSDLQHVSFGSNRIALIDVDTGEISSVPGFERAKNINPQWSPDGAALYFISDRGGISNVYRVALDGGAITQVTRLGTGVSGITASSPALSVARTSGRLMFSAYQDAAYHLVAIEPPAAGRDSLETPPAAGILPPVQRSGSEVSSLVEDARLGLVDRSSFTEKPYRASLSLDNVSQVSLGLGAANGGVAVGGGLTMYWSDMLGNHNLVTLLQFSNVGNDFGRNLAIGAGYMNLKSRWHWGGSASQIPIITRQIAIDEVPYPGETFPAVREQDFRVFQIQRDILGDIAYPFSRAQRVELSAGFQSIDFAGEVETRIFSQVTGNLLSESTDPLPQDSIPTINLAVASAALVYDNSYFGGTSPVLGQRYRFEVSPVAGDLDFVGVLGDYRRYIRFAPPLTLAGRVLHYGRYGPDGEDPQLSDLFLGYPSLIRGYNDASFTVDEEADFNRLLGSRIGVANVELRLPLLGGLGLIPSSGVPPVEIAGFFDAGMAWRKNEPGPFQSGARNPVTSHGMALRVNLLGFAVAELDFVHPNDRPQKGWYWEFSLQPGF